MQDESFTDNCITFSFLRGNTTSLFLASSWTWNIWNKASASHPLTQLTALLYMLQFAILPEFVVMGGNVGITSHHIWGKDGDFAMNTKIGTWILTTICLRQQLKRILAFSVWTSLSSGTLPKSAKERAIVSAFSPSGDPISWQIFSSSLEKRSLLAFQRPKSLLTQHDDTLPNKDCFRQE